MSDDITSPFPAGTKFATDEHPTKGHAQYAKLFSGGDGVFNPVTGDPVAGLSSDVRRQRTNAAFYASAEGGRTAFNAVTGYLTIPTGSGENNLCAFVNPSGSGVDAVLTLGEFGANANTRFRRYGGAATVSALGTPRPSGNRGGGSNASGCSLYVAGQYTPSGANETATPANAANLRKVAFLIANNQYITALNSEAIVRPGQQLLWTIDNDATSSFLAMVYLEWHEVAAA